MRIWLLATLLGCLALSGRAQEPPPRESLRVLVYNVKHGLGMDGRIDLDRLAARIRSTRPDLVALQEVDRGCGRSGGVDQAAWLGERTGMYAAFGAFMDYDGGEYGMALLSRRPMSSKQNLRLPDGPEPRTALAVEIEYAAGRTLRFVGLHLYGSEEQRRAQAAVVDERWAGAETPTLLIGDFNSRPGSPVMELFERHWTRVEKQGPRFTFPSREPDREIDFALLPSDAGLDVLDHRVLAEDLVSDHRPLWLELSAPLPRPADSEELCAAASALLETVDEEERDEGLERFEQQFDGGVDRLAFRAMERCVHAAGTRALAPPGRAGEKEREGRLSVRLRDERLMPVFLADDPGEVGPRPLLVVMHGGPPAHAAQAEGAARRVLEAWRHLEDEGWHVAAPALVQSVVKGVRGADSLPFEVLRPDEFDAVVRAVGRVRDVDRARVFAAGISLGANFSLGLAAAQPDRLAGVVPVSTEGEFRPRVLANTGQTSVFVLQGAKDRNIRDIAYPRRMAEQFAAWGTDHVYREFADRAHEGFDDQHGAVLDWMRPRVRDPWRASWRLVPNPGLFPSTRRRGWVETQVRGAFVEARRTGPTALEVLVQGAAEVRVWLHDDLVDLDRPITVTVNGASQGPFECVRSPGLALTEAFLEEDPGWTPAAVLDLEVPRDDEALQRAAEAREAALGAATELPLPWWEHFAAKALREWTPSLGVRGGLVEVPAKVAGRMAPDAKGFEVRELDADSDLVALGLEPGDLLFSVGDHLFHAERGLDEVMDAVALQLTPVAQPIPVVYLHADRLRFTTVWLRLEVD